MTILPDLDISYLINKFFQTHPEYQVEIESDSEYEPDSDYDTDEDSDLN
jgi:hypothetical protein